MVKRLIFFNFLFNFKLIFLEKSRFINRFRLVNWFYQLDLRNNKDKTSSYCVKAWPMPRAIYMYNLASWQHRHITLHLFASYSPIKKGLSPLILFLKSKTWRLRTNQNTGNIRLMKNDVIWINNFRKEINGLVYKTVETNMEVEKCFQLYQQSFMKGKYYTNLSSQYRVYL